MMSSCSGQNVALAVLSIWSLASLITIVVWSTSPDLKGSARCRTDLRQAAVELEGQRAVWGNERAELERQLEASRAEQELLQQRAILLLKEQERSNATLEECQQLTMLLQGNISALLDEREVQRQQLANLSALIVVQEERVLFLEHNATQALMATAACERLHAAAQHQAAAAVTQTKACRAHQDFLQHRLVACKTAEADAPQTQQELQPSPTPSQAPPPLLLSPGLLLLIGGLLKLLS
ncbi:unnamed protein product [Ophioblennius macclurei]